MEIVADESVDFRLIKAMEAEGLSVYAIAKHHPAIKDEVVLEIASEKNALLLTEDKDFGELTIRLKKSNSGILLLRAVQLSYSVRASLIISTIDRMGQKLLSHFTVINNNKRVRMRKLK